MLVIKLAQRSVLKPNAHVFGAATGEGIDGTPPPATVGTALGAGTELGTSLGTELGNELASCELALDRAAPNTRRLRRTLVRNGTFIAYGWLGQRSSGLSFVRKPTGLTMDDGIRGRSRHHAIRCRACTAENHTSQLVPVALTVRVATIEEVHRHPLTERATTSMHYTKSD
jgi:hypothetical protein